MGSKAFGISFGFEVNVLNEAPGPHRIIAWNPGAGRTACGMLKKLWRGGVAVVCGFLVGPVKLYPSIDIQILSE